MLFTKVKIKCANTKTSGGYISGELHIAITLRILATSDALDLDIIFYIESCYITTMMYTVLLNYVIVINIGSINIKND